MPSSVLKVTVPMAVVLCASHPPRSARRLCVPSARTKFIIVQAADVRVDAGRPALQSHLHHEIQVVKAQVTQHRRWLTILESISLLMGYNLNFSHSFIMPNGQQAVRLQGFFRELLIL